jgi:hypothetical protein
VNPSFELVGRIMLSPSQKGPIAIKVGVDGGPTFTVIVCVLAHCPAVGVKVYVVVAVLLIAGDHVPVKPSFDVVGRAEILAPEQYGPT